LRDNYYDTLTDLYNWNSWRENY